MVVVFWLEFNVHIFIEFNGVMLGMVLMRMVLAVRHFVVDFDGKLSLDLVQKLGQSISVMDAVECDSFLLSKIKLLCNNVSKFFFFIHVVQHVTVVDLLTLSQKSVAAS